MNHYSLSSYYCPHCGIWVSPSECDSMGKIKHNLCGKFVRTRPVFNKMVARRRRGYKGSDGFKRDALGRFT